MSRSDIARHEKLTLKLEIMVNVTSVQHNDITGNTTTSVVKVLTYINISISIHRPCYCIAYVYMLSLIFVMVFVCL